ncbi:sigma-70 family RNA polymerase sigma factor [Maribacter litopenaei]|uniref:Sigma-70 family RNA polymerase sigma factor n=1 Tax=Maribacter litopenaei TaxID=2976127 RepID=A0ABY5Y6I5_9FLAO|nr:sigma-70 family RNA polymerase sigma factor [Maribacter litopenaei]UWX54090.1 sigma-70 family RNA polymerase sigma factor [Maribacter litopenaei]
MDHLFRHQYGKMVSILTRIFGLSNLELIEDAVQDTFLKASIKWRNNIPENPEAWLTTASKNRVIDLLRKLKSESANIEKLSRGTSSISINNLFLAEEIEDSQLRMIFTACHPSLKPQDQIAFALKTISGFSGKEISGALLLNEDTVKKRLQRARRTIMEKKISFDFPDSKSLQVRLNRVHEVIYLIFNEGFHSFKKDTLIRQELCGEGLRLCKLILKKPEFRTSDGYGLFALLCFHASRIESKVGKLGEVIDLKNQDRKLWHKPLIDLGKDALLKSSEFAKVSSFQIEASIALEHVIAKSFSDTNWDRILQLYKTLYNFNNSPYTLLNQSIVLIQLSKTKEARELLDNINPDKLEQRSYLYYGTMAECYFLEKDYIQALSFINEALKKVLNKSERTFLEEKKLLIENSMK